MNDLQERVNAAVELGSLDGAEADVIEECALRYVLAENRRRARNRARNTEALAEVKAQHRARTRERVAAVVDTMSTELSALWSAEVLGSGFIVNGELVTWETATVEQHEAYALMLSVQASGTLETAARHRRAVQHILSVPGARTLGEAIASCLVP